MQPRNACHSRIAQCRAFQTVTIPGVTAAHRGRYLGTDGFRRLRKDSRHIG
jgi:hypothetical protein